MPAILEAVPNFSDGRDPAVLRALVEAAEGVGATVVDASSDPDHHRAVLTIMGRPGAVLEAAVATARVALDRIDLEGHDGVHPRIGALDVLPFVPLAGMTMAEAVEVAHEAGRRLAELGIPVYWYANASTPPGRRLADLRRGGVEALRDGWPEGRHPDLDAGRGEPHPTAGATCVGARPVLLAWNVWIEEVPFELLRELARRLRESAGGFDGLRALAIRLPRQAGMQISMNLEDVERTDPFEVFLAIEGAVLEAGGRIGRTEVIGMIPEPLVLAAGAHRLRLSGATSSRLLGSPVVQLLSGSNDPDAETVARWLEMRTDVPGPIREAAMRMRGPTRPVPRPGDDA